MGERSREHGLERAPNFCWVMDCFERYRVRKRVNAAWLVLTMSFAAVDETPLVKLPELKRKLNLSEDIDTERQGARNAVLRWIVWRSKAMRLAFILSCIVSVLSFYQFGAQMAEFFGPK